MIYTHNMPQNSIVAINSFDGEKISGKIRGMYRESEQDINGFAQLLKIILPISENIEDMSQENIDMKNISKNDNAFKGKLCTFVIELIGSDEISIRGKITWIEGKKTEFFRSELELMKMILQVAENSKEII